MCRLTEGVLFLGCGASAHAHSAALAVVGPALPRYYASRDGARARATCVQHRGAGWYGSYAEALETAPASTVVITTPLATHFELTFLALAADRHVIVDSPAFPRAADFELVRDAARAAGRSVLVAANWFYRPLTEHLRGIIAARTLGEIRLLQVNALSMPVPRPTSAARRTSPADLRADLLDWVSVMAGLGLPACRISRHPAGATPGPTRVVAIEYANGAVGLLVHSQEVAARFRLFHLSSIHGTEGSALFETGGRFFLERGRRRRLMLSARDDARGRRSMFTDFLHALRGDREPRYTLVDAHRDLRLLERIRAIPSASAVR